MKRILVCAMGSALVVGMTLGALRLSAGDKVLICHVEGQNSGRAHVIEVSINALLKHLDHGDSLSVAAGLHAGDECTIPDTTGSLN